MLKLLLTILLLILMQCCLSFEDIWQQKTIVRKIKEKEDITPDVEDKVDKKVTKEVIHKEPRSPYSCHLTRSRILERRDRYRKMFGPSWRKHFKTLYTPRCKTVSDWESTQCMTNLRDGTKDCFCVDEKGGREGHLIKVEKGHPEPKCGAGDDDDDDEDRPKDTSEEPPIEDETSEEETAEKIEEIDVSEKMEKDNDDLTICRKMKKKYEEMYETHKKAGNKVVSLWIPQCSEDGSFIPVQCGEGKRGRFCFCIDAKHQKPRWDTMIFGNEKEPDCV